MQPVVSETRTVLVVEREPATRERVSSILSRAGYHVTRAADWEEARSLLAARQPDAAIVGLDAPARRVADLLGSLRRVAAGLPLLVLAGPDELAAAVKALRFGAEDYLLRPPNPFELRLRLGRILERRDMDLRITFLQDEVSKKYGFRDPVTRSATMKITVARAMRVAPMRSTVLILGESGVGKELVARAIHLHSPRRDQPFIALNCAAMPASLIESELFGHEKGSFTGAHARARGKFEIAHGGTLFLDEIGEMESATQAKLLRVLEEREFMRIGGDHSIRVDVRVIAATNADIEDLVARKRFRRDLYYRLKVITIRVPPLRERREDIPVLVETFLQELARANAVPVKKVTPEAMVALQSYRWPGNVRELKNILENMLVSFPGDAIDTEHLPPVMRGNGGRKVSSDPPVGVTLRDMERDLIRRTLEHTGGNRTHSAEILGIGVRTLQRKILEYEIRVPPRRRRPRGAAS